MNAGCPRVLVRAESARHAPQTLGFGSIIDEAFAYRTGRKRADTARVGTGRGRSRFDHVHQFFNRENFLGLFTLARMRIASIGPITSKTLRDHGLNVDVEARRHDIDGLVQAVRELFAEKAV